jgi:5-carboxymethyl-2-hydroxymuconate isomerase
MPGIRHEAAAQLFHDNPEFPAFLLAALGVRISEGRAVISDSNLSLPDPGLALPALSTVESRADVVTITLDDATGAVRHVVISEPQTSPPRLHKWWTWLTYIAIAGRRYRRPVTLLVLALSDSTARACRAGFQTGHPDLALAPVLVTRHSTPDPGSPGARPFAAQLTMLGVLNGKFTLSDAATRDYVLEQFTHADEPIRTAYTRIILQIAKRADQQALKALEEALKTKFRVPIIDDAVDEATARGIQQGIELAEVDMLLLILEERFTVSDETRIRVQRCGNVKRLKEWARRAVTAQSLDDIFAGG